MLCCVCVVQFSLIRFKLSYFKIHVFFLFIFRRCESGGCSTAGSTTGLDDQYLDMDFGRKLNLSSEGKPSIFDVPIVVISDSSFMRTVY